MAITFVTIPGGTAYGDSLHYAAHADSPLKVTSNKGDEDNFLFKVEILNGSLVSLITCYFPPTSIVTTTATLETNLGDIVKNLIPAVEPIEANKAFRINSTSGYLYHKIKVTEVYNDGNGIPAEGATETTPSGGTFAVAHNIAHEGAPGMNLGIYPQAFLTNDIDGIFPVGSHKQLSVWVDPAITQDIGARVVVLSPFGNSFQYIKAENGDIPITRPTHGRIILPINKQTLSISNKATGLIVTIFPLVAPPPVPIGIEIKPPLTNPPPGGGVLIETATEHGFQAGNVIVIDNTEGAAHYNNTYEIISVPTTKTAYIKAEYDPVEAEDENYRATVTFVDDVGETLPYAVEYKVKQTGCYYPVIYANHWGGFDVVDFISEDSMSVNANRDRVKLNGLKRAFATQAAKRRELSSGWIEEADYELYQGLIASNRHFKVEENSPVEVLMLTDSAKLMERREMVNVQVMIEEQDLITNNE